MKDFDDFLNASGDEEDRHLEKPKSQGRSTRGGSPSYRGGRGAGRGDAFSIGRGGDPYGSIELPENWQTPKTREAKSKTLGREKRGERSEPASSPSETVRSSAARSKQGAMGGATPSAKSEPAKKAAVSSDSESSGAGQSESGENGPVSLFANYKADIDQQLRESQEEMKRQEEERERKKKEEEERKRAEEAKRKEEEQKKAEEAARLEEKRREEEAKKQEEERKKKEEEAKKRAEEEEAKKREEERQRQEVEEAKKKEEEERLKREEEMRKQEEEQKKLEAETQKEEELRRQEAEETRRKEEEQHRQEEEERRQREEHRKQVEAEEERKRREAEAMLKAEESQKRHVKLEDVEKNDERSLPTTKEAEEERKKEEKERTPATSPASSVRVASPSFSASPHSTSPTVPKPPESSPRAQSPPPPSRSPSPTASQNLPPSKDVATSSAISSRVQSHQSPSPKAPPMATPPAPQAPQAPQLMRSVSSSIPIPNSAPRLPVPARTLEVPEERVTGTNSLPFMPQDLSRSGSVAPLGAAPGPAHPSDRWCLPCDDGKLLVLRSTESAEQQEMTAYWRAQARGQVLDVPRFPDANTSLLMASTSEPSPSSRQSREHDADAPDPALLELAQRVDRMKLEKCQSEIQGLKKKLVLLEEFNSDLAKLKTTAETEAMQLDQQLMRSRMENKKLQDALSNQASQVRELRDAKIAQEEQVQEAQEQMSAAAQQVVEATSKQAVLSQRVASLTQELAGLREERDTLKEDLAALCSKDKDVETRLEQSSTTPKALLGRMQAELAMSEKMLRACEKENENLAQQNRQLRQGARLQREEVDGRQLQLVAELNAAKAEADTNPASMRRVAELERELVAAKERADEHGRELERCREAKRQLEREIIAGPSKPSNQEKVEAIEARCALAQSEVAEMQEKLRYYAQSQQAMEEDRRQVASLSEELRTAKTENVDLRRRPGLKEASKKIAELRRQNEELNECLRKRHPDSILALIKACEPAPEERRELRDLKGRIVELEAQLQERDAMYDRRIRGLRAQYDHMRHEYERRSEIKKASDRGDLEEPRRVGPDHEAVLQARIKDLERQVEHTKSYYLSKLRKREPLVPPWKPSGKSTNHGPQNEARLQQLQQQLQEREQRIAELESFSHRQMASPQVTTLRPSPPAPPTPTSMTSKLIRLFMSSPEGTAVVALCTAQHWLCQATRLERYEEVAAHAEMLVPIFLAAESAAKGPVEMEMSAGYDTYGTHRVLLQQDDALRLEMPLLPSSVWKAWRHTMQRVAVLGSEASLGTRPKLQLLEAMTEMRQGAEAVIQQLLDASGETQSLESMLPRLSLEAVREDLDQQCEDQVSLRLLEDAEAQAGLDHRLPWAELLAVLARSGISKPCLDLCRLAARPDFSVSLSDLRGLWQGADLQSYVGVFKALARIRLALSRDPAALGQLERAAVAGFLPRGEFMEALRALPCALNLEERHQIASLFSPAGDVRRVCYPLFLHSVVPERFDEAVALQFSAKADEEWQLRLEEAKAESRGLRDQLLQQEARSAEQARQIATLGAEEPAQAVRRLQGEVYMLEAKVLEQQAMQSAAARKSEIALRAELDVKNHEVSSLKRALEARNSEVCRYEAELSAIIAELNVLREQP